MTADTTDTTEPMQATQATIVRFDRTERALHWVNAVLVLGLLATGLALYAGPISTVIGRRPLVKAVHVWSGLLLPVPVIVALAGRWGAALRADLATMNRWTADDRRWWRRSARRGARLGKFNPGQKLNTAFVGGSLAVLLGTGIVMRWFEPFPDTWRTGATFAHDWFAFGLGLAVAAHVVLALADPVSLRAMRRGTVPVGWARRNRPRWHEETTGMPSGDARDDG
ncbi:MAG: cytochrome b/b6 domain-containing protein [Acidimicrobiia bacterium]|nr:cytochrome b/b6 domain-containing protein [Acidimicrobiia bacterium]